MKITYAFRHMEASQAVIDHVEDKINKIEKYLISGIDAHVVLSVEKIRHQCEIQVRERDFKATATEVSENMYASVDVAVHKLERQLKKHKDRVKNHKIKSAREASQIESETSLTPVVE